VLIRLSLIFLILCSQASHANFKNHLLKSAGVIAVIHAVLYGISAYQEDGDRELEKMGGWEWDLIYGFMRVTMKVLPKTLKDSFETKGYDELYEKIIKVQFSYEEGELIPGIAEKLIADGIVESGDVLSHPLHEPPNWVIRFFHNHGIAIEDYSAYTHWAVYQETSPREGFKKGGRVIDFDTRTEPRAPSWERYLLERANQGKKYLWIMKPRKRDLIGLSSRISHVLKNEGTDYRLAHASSNIRDAFMRAFWRGDNCESLSFEIATGTAYSEQSAAFRLFTYLFSGTAVTIATVVVYRCLFTQRQRS